MCSKHGIKFHHSNVEFYPKTEMLFCTYCCKGSHQGRGSQPLYLSEGVFCFVFFFTLQLYLTCGLSFYLLVYFSFIGTISLLIMTDGKALCVCVPFPPKIPFSNSVCSQVCKQIWLGLYDDRTSSVPDFREPQKVKEFLQDKYEKKRWYVSIISLLRKDLCQCALCKGVFFVFLPLSLAWNVSHVPHSS